jgi:TolA-binding protein
MDSPKAGLRAFGERVQEALVAETRPAEQLRSARVRLIEQVTDGRHSARPGLFALRFVWLARASARFDQPLHYAALAALAGLAIALVVLLQEPSPRPISFVAGKGGRGIGDLLEAGERERLGVEFSEGSLMLLHEGARARVLETEVTGARVLLEGGAADVSIVHGKGRATRWRFEVGPFQVLVKGTRFELSWQPLTQALTLTMQEGSVELSGPCLSAPRLVERGASLRLSCAKPAPAEPTPTAGAAVAATPPPDSVLPEPASARVAAPEPRKPAPRSFAGSCETADKTELVALANRERLAGSVARARTALLALRRRFPGSSESGTAAFMLGRMAFDQQANYPEAARWFASYLSEQPNGPLMGDAAGRLLEAHEREGNRTAARRAAEAYLGRFPDGPYARRAKRILTE